MRLNVRTVFVVNNCLIRLYHMIIKNKTVYNYHFETFERRCGKSVMLGAYILIKDITKGKRFGSSAFRIF